MLQARFLRGEEIHRAAGVSGAVGRLAGREGAGQTEKMFDQQQLLGMGKMSMLAGVVVDHQLANMKQVEAEAEVPVAMKRDCLPKGF